MSAWSRLTQTLLILFAFCWPLSSLLYVPLVDTTITPALAVAIAIVFIVELAVSRRARVPLEFLGPVLVLCGFAALFAWQDETRLARALLYALAMGTAACALLSNEKSGTAVAMAFALGGGAAGVFELAGRWLEWYPMGASSRVWVHFSFSNTLTAIVTLTLSGSLGLFLAVRCRLNRSARVLCAAAGIVALAPVLIGLVETLPGGRDYWRSLILRDSPGPLHATASEKAALVVGLWLLARIAAKAMFAPAPREHPLRQFAMIALLAALIAIVMVPMRVFYGYGFLAGIAAGLSLPAVDRAAAPFRSWPALCGIVLVLAALNSQRVHLENDRDPRNYAASIDRHLSDDELVSAFRTTYVVSARKETESRLWLLRAEIALASNQLDIAGTAFARIFDPNNDATPLLPDPSPEERALFLAALSEAVSEEESPPAALALIQARFAHGDRDAALYALKQLAGKGRIEVECDPEPLRRVLAALIADDPSQSQLLADFSSTDAATLIRIFGGTVEAAPGNFPRSRLPFAVVAWHGYDAIELGAMSPGDIATTRVRVPGARRPGQGDRSKLALVPVLDEATGGWRIAYVRHPDHEIASFMVSPDGGAVRASETLKVPYMDRSYAPSILVWIP